MKYTQHLGHPFKALYWFSRHLDHSGSLLKTGPQKVGAWKSEEITFSTPIFVSKMQSEHQGFLTFSTELEAK